VRTLASIKKAHILSIPHSFIQSVSMHDSPPLSLSLSDR
jgi:hypothetical protein